MAKRKSKASEAREAPTDDVMKAFDVARNTVCRWARAGAPHSYVNGTPRSGYLWNVDELRAWLEKNHPKQWKKEADPDAYRASVVSKTSTGEEISLAEAKRRKEIALAETAELKVGKLRGELLDAGDVEAGQLARVASVKAGLLALPGKLGARLVGLEARRIELEIREEVTRLLDAYAGKVRA